MEEIEKNSYNNVTDAYKLVDKINFDISYVSQSERKGKAATSGFIKVFSTILRFRDDCILPHGVCALNNKTRPENLQLDAQLTANRYQPEPDVWGIAASFRIGLFLKDSIFELVTRARRKKKNTHTSRL